MKQLSSHKSHQLGFSVKRWRMWDLPSVCRCSNIFYYTKIKILMWFFCLFSTGLNQVIGRTSFRFNLKEDEAWSIIMKQLSSHISLQLGFLFKCRRMWDLPSVCRSSMNFNGKWLLVSPITRMRIIKAEIYVITDASW